MLDLPGPVPTAASFDPEDGSFAIDFDGPLLDPPPVIDALRLRVANFLFLVNDCELETPSRLVGLLDALDVPDVGPQAAIYTPPPAEIAGFPPAGNVAPFSLPMPNEPGMLLGPGDIPPALEGLIPDA